MYWTWKFGLWSQPLGPQGSKDSAIYNFEMFSGNWAHFR